MANQQLIDYIRQQLISGITKDTIKIALASEGWSEQDIAEGFSIIDKSPLNPSIPTQVTQTQAESTTTLNEKISMPSTNTGSVIWTKAIPRTNNVFMVISLLLVLGLDLVIIISSPGLINYWYMMLGVLAVFALFFCLENFVLRKKFADTTSVLDKWISLIIVIRNLIFLLNFIPFIQLLGLVLLAGFFAVIPSGLLGAGDLGLGLGSLGWIAPALVVLYIILVIARFSVTKRGQNGL